MGSRREVGEGRVESGGGEGCERDDVCERSKVELFGLLGGAGFSRFMHESWEPRSTASLISHGSRVVVSN
jgi:hypothetical protein